MRSSVSHLLVVSLWMVDSISPIHGLARKERRVPAQRSSLTAAAPLATKKASPSESASVADSNRNGHYHRTLDKIYDHADTDKDGKMTFTECYEMLLKFYIELNRQAPIPAPNRKTVHTLFREFDLNDNRRISRDEFTALANVLVGRAAARLSSFKFLQMVVAPLTAFAILRFVEANFAEGLAKWAQQNIPEQLVPLATNKDVWRAVVIVLCVSQLGKRVLDLVDWWLDADLREEDTA